jgi:hypothetical protein
VTTDINESREKPLAEPEPRRFYRTRHRISTGLMIFVVVVGLPIIAIPDLRQRLSDRVRAIKLAVAGGIAPVALAVGSSRGPIPAELASPAPVPLRAPALPDLNRVFTMDGKTAASKAAPAPPPRPPQMRPASEIPLVVVNSAKEQKEDGDEAGPAPADEPEVKYQRGKAEQEAFDLLVKMSPVVAGLVQGSDPSLKFRAWDAANRGEDLYWVRLKFQPEGNPEAEYIWQVKVQSGQATPLNYNARSLSQ